MAQKYIIRYSVISVNNMEFKIIISKAGKMLHIKVQLYRFITYNSYFTTVHFLSFYEHLNMFENMYSVHFTNKL